jgi:hypothetical protein
VRAFAFSERGEPFLTPAAIIVAHLYLTVPLYTPGATLLESAPISLFPRGPLETVFSRKTASAAPEIIRGWPEFRWTVDWENLFKEKSHVHRKQKRFGGCAGILESD